MQTDGFQPGATDLEARAALLAQKLSPGLRPLARVAYNYRWSWARDGEAVFRAINEQRWTLSGQNPVQFLNDLWPSTQEAVERNPELLERIEALTARVAADLERPHRPRPGINGPVVFMCAEFGFHRSLPIYSGGLGVLAGDILKEASDQALETIGIGLLYRRGYFRQRLDIGGRQQEYWVDCDPKSMPMARVTAPDGKPLLLEVPLAGSSLHFQVWRVDVGRVPLLLLDADVLGNDAVQRWTTVRLYDGNRAVRLAQYGLLGIGGARLLKALEIEPAVIHMNEGHPALAALELAADLIEGGTPPNEAFESVRRRFVFTTHTPVPAGNETYAPEEFLEAYSDLRGRLDLDEDAFLDLCRSVPDADPARPGMTPLALRMSRRRNGVSRLHGEVSRRMWQPLFPGHEGVPITHVTNGAHLPTFVSEPIRLLLTRHIGEDWLHSPADTRCWEGVSEIPNAELWATRCEARRRLVEYLRGKAEEDSLQRGEQLGYVRRIASTLDPEALTLGFARRVAIYKRIHLMTHDPERLRRLLGGSPPVQLVIAGKAHPNDSDGKRALERFYGLAHADPLMTGRVVIAEDYDLGIAAQLVGGCDVWVNLPRKPLEASGTSGMKATFNGALQLSVLDGWWAEAYNGSNGWAIPGDDDPNPDVVDARDAERFYELLEHEVIPLFNERDENGVPQRWCDKIKEALVSCAPAFSASRMVNDYVERIYAAH
ncbi:MAG TPA: alpha-glucan family phosphorylase [Gaiellaceae bacterium]|nr:alpha-glucan family phosphorylase [Gaiellaceae bacterium]